MLDDMATTANSVEIDPFGLQPGEAEQVGRAIAAVLRRRRAAKPRRPVPKLDVSGAWDVRVTFLHGERTHRLRLAAAGWRDHRQPEFAAVRGPGDAAVSMPTACT